MSSQQEVVDFRKKLNDLRTGLGRNGSTYSGKDVLGSIANAYDILGNNYNGTDADRSRAVAQAQSILKNNSSAFYELMGQPNFARARGGMDAAGPSLRELYTGLSSVPDSTFVDPAAGGGTSTAQPIPGSPVAPPTVDQQVVADQAKIETEGQRQNQQMQDFITGDAATRASARDQLAQLLTQKAQQSFSETLPQTAEDYNSHHLLNSSGYGNEVARQQANLASQIANQVGMQGFSDIDLQSRQKQAALGGMQSFQTAGLNRGFNLDDFVRQGNLAREIGAASTPKVGNGKGVGTGIAGAGTGAAIGTQILPGWGTAIGGGLGALAGGGGGK